MAQDLTQEALKALLSYSADTGQFRWVKSRGTAKAGAVAGNVCQRGYVHIKVNRKLYAAHRLAWLYVHGCFPSQDTDHINGVKSDNRISNLRDVSRGINVQNRQQAKATNKLGVLGVSLKNGRFLAQIKANGRSTHLGYFDNAEHAHRAYVAARSAIEARP